MKWKKRAAEIALLKAKHGKDRSLARPLPDLTVEQRVAPLSNRLDTRDIAAKKPQPTVKLGPNYTISLLSKSGYQVMLKKEAPWFGKKT
jgi:hypothetical protein